MDPAQKYPDDWQQKIKLPVKDREMNDQLADLYSIIIATEHLERAYIKASITPAEYTPMCLQLICQYKILINLLNIDALNFIHEYQIHAPAALKRLVEIGVPATVEHSVSDNQSSARNIAETVQFFITLMDSLKLNIVAVDEIHPQLSDLMTTMSNSKISAKTKIREWLVILNQLKASDELGPEQVRQLLFDLER